MWRVLIVFGTEEGQTEKITNIICTELVKRGHTVDIFNSETIPEDVLPQNYDGFIGGASVHISGYPYSFKKWIARHSSALNSLPSAFFSVCLGVLQKDENVQREEVEIMDNFFSESKWTPTSSTIFAGALKYTKYNWFLKRIMRRIAGRAGGGTDIQRDYEYTDWEKVKEFAYNCHHLFSSYYFKKGI